MDMSDPVLSPLQSPAHPLPPRPLGAAVVITNSPSGTPQPSTPVKAAPKTRGGFQMDDGDDQDNTIDDAQDDDVYGSPTVSATDGTAPVADQARIDSSPRSPAQEKENGSTSVPAQVSADPANVSSSIVPAPSQQVNGSSAAANSATLTSSDLPSALPKSRLAHDTVGILEDRIKADPLGDTAAWLQLIEEYKNRNKEEEVRQTYKRYLDIFPLAAEQWCAWTRWEESHERRFQMENIFKLALMKVPSVELWSIYINYVRRRNSMQGAKATQSYATIQSAFDFVLQNVGLDMTAGQLWQDYINFMKSGPGVVGGGEWQDKQKADILREAYKKALRIPHSALQTLWKDYDLFENSLNKTNARKYMAELSSDYTTARSAYRALENITRDVQRTSRPRLPPAYGYAGDEEYQTQVQLWTQWIDWEKKDELGYREEKKDKEYKDRVIFTYKQALMALQFWPEIWYDAAVFCFAHDLDQEGLDFLEKGFKSNPESALLAFKLADRLESTTTNDDTNDPGAKQRMQKVREPYYRVLDALYDIDDKTAKRLSADIQALDDEAALQADSQVNGDGATTTDDAMPRGTIIEARKELLRGSAKAHLEMLGKIISHVWIALMRATRRIQGKGLPGERSAGFRAIFNEARKRGKLTPDFYVETAQIEWQCYRDTTGTRIFERGVKLYPEDNYLPLEYIKHLISKDDITNARAVFEQTTTRFLASNNPALVAKSKPLFAFLHDHESKFGELSQIRNLEERMTSLFPEDPNLSRFAARYQTPDFDPLMAQPIISPTQTIPKTDIPHPSIEANPSIAAVQSQIDAIIGVNSPKRPLPLDDDDEPDNRPSKMARGDSPMVTVPLRKIAQPAAPSTRAHVPPLPAPIFQLLSILPKATAYTDVRFDAAAIHRLIRDVHLPPPGSVGAPRLQPSAQQAPSQAGWPPQYPPPPQGPPPIMPPQQGYLQSGVSQPPYAAAPFRFQ